MTEILYAGLPPQPPRPAGTTGEGEWVALLSGLALGGSEKAELKGGLLAEWLTGELGGEEDGEEAVKITRLILAGNSLAQPREDEGDDKKPVSHTFECRQLRSHVWLTVEVSWCRHDTGTTRRCSRPSRRLRWTRSWSWCCRR